MERKEAFLFLAIVLVSLLTGCWSSREMNQLAIAVGLGIDKEGNKYRISTQVVNTGEVAPTKKTGNAPVTMYSTSGDTVFEALTRMTTISPRKIYFSHLRIVVIGEKLAKEGIGEILDFLSRNHELRDDFYILVSKGASADETLKILTPLEDIPANKLFSSLRSSEEAWSATMVVTLDQLITDLVSEGKHPVLTALQVKGDREMGETRKNVEEINPSGQLLNRGLAVFNNDKLIGWLNEEESRGYNYILDNVKSSVGHVACSGGGKVVLEVIRTKTKVTGRVEKGQPQVDIDLKLEGNVGEIECKKLDLTKTKTVYDLEKRAEQKLKGHMESTINKVKREFKTDIFGFGEAIRRSDPKAWKTLKSDWDEEHFVDLPVNIKVDFKIRRQGTERNSFLNKMRE